MSKTQDILVLLDKGYVPYSCAVPESYYTKKGCGRPDKAEWFMRPRSKAHRQVRCMCVGCRRRCTAVDPAGWPHLLEDYAPRPGVVAYAVVDMLSVDELLRLKKVLRVEEAAWALNVSRQKVHNWLDEGLLDPVPGSPVRITSSSVQRILGPE